LSFVAAYQFTKLVAVKNDGNLQSTLVTSRKSDTLTVKILIKKNPHHVAIK